MIAASSVTVGEVAGIIASVAVAILAVGLLFALFSLSRTLRELRTAVEQFRGETLPLVGQLKGTVTQANAELERVDTLLGTAESIGATVDSASRLAYLFFANPLVKALAFGAGSTRAYRRLRRGSSS
jgi:HAMP domain-containing protein